MSTTASLATSAELLGQRGLIQPSIRPHLLTTPVNFGTQTSPCKATHVGFLRDLPPHLAFAFWGPGFKYNLYSLGYLQRQGGSYSSTKLPPNQQPRLRVFDDKGNLIDLSILSSSNLYPANPHIPPSSTQPSLAAAATTKTHALNPPSSLPRTHAAVEALHHLYHHASDSTLTAGIKSGSIQTDVTPHDIIAYRAVNGPCISCIEGKLRDRPHPPFTLPRGTHPGSDLYIDIHDLPEPSLGGSTTSIRCVDGLTTRLDVQGALKKTSREILIAILTIVTTAYNAFSHAVERIWTDSEAVFKSLRAALGLLGIELKLFTPLDHNRFFERYNQTLETLAASTRAGLPYILPPKYDLQLAADIATKLNALPNSRTGPDSCPYTLVTKLTPPTPKGTFGLVYMVDSSDQQRLLTAKHQGTGVKATDKAIPAIHMGHNTLWPSAPQFLLPNGCIVTRLPRSPPPSLSSPYTSNINPAAMPTSHTNPRHPHKHHRPPTHPQCHQLYTTLDNPIPSSRIVLYPKLSTSSCQSPRPTHPPTPQQTLCPPQTPPPPPTLLLPTTTYLPTPTHHIS